MRVCCLLVLCIKSHAVASPSNVASVLSCCFERKSMLTQMRICEDMSKEIVLLTVSNSFWAYRPHQIGLPTATATTITNNPNNNKNKEKNNKNLTQLNYLRTDAAHLSFRSRCLCSELKERSKKRRSVMKKKIFQQTRNAKLFSKRTHLISLNATMANSRASHCHSVQHTTVVATCVCVFGTCVVIMAAGCQACQLLIYTNKHIHISAPMCFVHPPALIWPLSGMSFVVATAFAANFNINFAVDFPRTRHFLFNQCTFLRLFLYLLLLLS